MRIGTTLTGLEAVRDFIQKRGLLSVDNDFQYYIHFHSSASSQFELREQLHKLQGSMTQNSLAQAQELARRDMMTEVLVREKLEREGDLVRRLHSALDDRQLEKEGRLAAEQDRDVALCQLETHKKKATTYQKKVSALYCIVEPR